MRFPPPEHPGFSLAILTALSRRERIHDAPYWGFVCPTRTTKWGDDHIVYAIGGQEPRPVKIGITSDIKKRVKSLEAGNTWGLKAHLTRRVPYVIARQVEMKLHEHFAEKARGREWFDVEAAEIADVVDLYARRARQAVKAFVKDAEALADEVEEWWRLRRMTEEELERERLQRHAEQEQARLAKVAARREAALARLRSRKAAAPKPEPKPKAEPRLWREPGPLPQQRPERPMSAALRRYFADRGMLSDA